MLPWLWFWLVLYLVNFPNLIAYLWEQNLKDFFVDRFGFLQDRNPLIVLTNLSNIVELAPFVVIFLGILTILFPRIRAFFLEKHYRLKAVDPAGAIKAIQEINAYVAAHMPNIHLSANLNRSDQFAFIYPLGYRGSAMALFGGMVILWRKDQPGAQAMLLHEIAHHRNGDGLIVGAGSLLQWLLDHWIWLFLFTGLLPLLLVGGVEVVNAWQEFGGLRLEAWTANNEIGQLLRDHLGLTLVGAVIISVTLVIRTAWVIVLPLLGVWTAELMADRFVCETLQSTAEMSRAVQHLRWEKSNLWQRLLTGMSHPPVPLRQWAIRHFNQPVAWVATVLIFPLAYLLKLLLNIAMTIGILWSPSWDWGGVVQLILEGIQSFLYGTVPFWIFMLVLILIWPVIAPYWEWFFAGKRGAVDGSKYRWNAISAGLIGVIAITGWVAAGRISIPPAPVEQRRGYAENQQFKIGEVIPASGLEVTVLGWKELGAEANTLPPQPGYRYITVDLSLVNTGVEIKSISALAQLELQDGQGKQYRLTPNVNVILNSPVPDGMMMAGEQLRGVVGYEVPKDASDLTLIFIDQPAPIHEGIARVDLGQPPLPDPAPRQISGENPNKPHNVAEPIQLEQLVFTVDQVEFIKPGRVFQPQAGYGIIAIEISLENKGNSVESLLSTIQMHVEDHDGLRYDVDVHATFLADPDRQEMVSKINPGEKVTFRLGYEVPRTAGPFMFTYEREKDRVFVQLPALVWPDEAAQQQPALVTPTPTIAAGQDLTYQIPEKWILYRKKAGLPDLTGNPVEDYLTIFKECKSGIPESCDVEKVFLVSINQATQVPQTTPTLR